MKKGASTETENVVKTIMFGNPPVQQQPQAQQQVQQPQGQQPQHVPQQPQQHVQQPQGQQPQHVPQQPQQHVQQPQVQQPNQGQAQPDINLQSQPQQPQQQQPKPDINALNAQQLQGMEVAAHGIEDAHILNNILPPDIKVTDIRQQGGSNECFFVGTLLGALTTSWGKATLRDTFKEQGNNVQIQIQGKQPITLNPQDLANEHNSGGSETNAPWVKTLEQAYFKETGHSLQEMGEIVAAPRFFNWNIDHWPPQDMNFNDKQQVKESVRSWITEAKNGDFGVTYLRHGHVVAIKGIEGDNVVCINSLRQHEEPEERVSLDDIVNSLTQNKANFAKFKPA
jgi:Cell division protein